MFKADRVMKTYSVGRDNVTEARLRSLVKAITTSFRTGGVKESSGSPRIPTSEEYESAEYFARRFSDNWVKKAGVRIDSQCLRRGSFERSS
jgi:hypothetical protein